MSIYELNLGGIRKTFMEFHQSVYGRTVFLLAYFIPFALFLAAALTALFAIFNKFNPALLNASAICILAFFPTFIVGNIYFYGEIRRFCEHKEHNKHLSEKKK